MQNNIDIYLPCTCEADVLRVQKFDGEDEIYLCVYSFMSQKFNIFDRLKILFGGRLKTCDIILTEENFNKLKTII